MGTTFLVMIIVLFGVPGAFGSWSRWVPKWPAILFSTLSTPFLMVAAIKLESMLYWSINSHEGGGGCSGGECTGGQMAAGLWPVLIPVFMVPAFFVSWLVIAIMRRPTN